jgi:hypothetical protein
VKSPTSCTLNASGALNEKACALPPPFDFNLFAISISSILGLMNQSPGPKASLMQNSGNAN